MHREPHRPHARHPRDQRVRDVRQPIAPKPPRAGASRASHQGGVQFKTRTRKLRPKRRRRRRRSGDAAKRRGAPKKRETRRETRARARGGRLLRRIARRFESTAARGVDRRVDPVPHPPAPRVRRPGGRRGGRRRRRRRAGDEGGDDRSRAVSLGRAPARARDAPEERGHERHGRHARGDAGDEDRGGERGERRGAGRRGDSSAAAQRPRRRTYSNPHWSHRRHDAFPAPRARDAPPVQARDVDVSGRSPRHRHGEKSLPGVRAGETDSRNRRGRSGGAGGGGGGAGAGEGGRRGDARDRSARTPPRRERVRGRVPGGPRGDSAPADPARRDDAAAGGNPIARGAGAFERRARPPPRGAGTPPTARAACAERRPSASATSTEPPPASSPIPRAEQVRDERDHVPPDVLATNNKSSRRPSRSSVFGARARASRAGGSLALPPCLARSSRRPRAPRMLPTLGASAPPTGTPGAAATPRPPSRGSWRSSRRSARPGRPRTGSAPRTRRSRRSRRPSARPSHRAPRAGARSAARCTSTERRRRDATSADPPARVSIGTARRRRRPPPPSIPPPDPPPLDAEGYVLAFDVPHAADLAACAAQAEAEAEDDEDDEDLRSDQEDLPSDLCSGCSVKNLSSSRAGTDASSPASPRRSSWSPSSASDALSFFRRFGFVIFRGVLTPRECELTRAEIWDAIERRHSGGDERKDGGVRLAAVRRDDPRTYGAMSSKTYGLAPDPAVFTERCVRNRQSPSALRCLALTLGLADVGDALVSHDRWCLYRPTVFSDGDGFFAPEAGGGGGVGSGAASTSPTLSSRPEWRTRENLHLDLNPWVWEAGDGGGVGDGVGRARRTGNWKTTPTRVPERGGGAASPSRRTVWRSIRFAISAARRTWCAAPRGRTSRAR